MTTQARLLYVDDDEALAFLVRRFLMDAGYAVTVCSAAAEALQKLTEQHGQYDLVMSDIHLPGMSGLEFARKALSHYPELAVLLLSGFIEPEQQRQAALIGVRKCMLKPVNIQDLVAATQNLLRADLPARA
jgi:CheY-like chemotaxis protein